MNISDVMRELKHLQSMHGDLPVSIERDDEWEPLHVVEYHNAIGGYTGPRVVLA